MLETNFIIRSKPKCWNIERGGYFLCQFDGLSTSMSRIFFSPFPWTIRCIGDEIREAGQVQEAPRFIFQGSKTGPAVSTLNPRLECAEGSNFFRRFSDFCSFKMRLLRWPTQRNRDSGIPRNLLASGLGSPPFRGADCPAGPN